MGFVAADEVELRLVAVQQPLKVKKRRGFGEHLDHIVAGAAGEMRHGRVIKPHRAVDDLVERSVAAAGIETDFFTGCGRFTRDAAAVAGLFRAVNLIGKASRAAHGFNLPGVFLRAVIFSRGRVDNKNMLHDGTFFFFFRLTGISA